MSQIEGTSTSVGDDRCAEWMKEWDAWPTAFDLSIPRNCDGRPIWEPPILDYSPWIGEEYEKMRKAMLEYTGGDVARTTDIMDVNTEEELLAEYKLWAVDNDQSAVSSESKKFFLGLTEELYRDWLDAFTEWDCSDGGLYYATNEDGTYHVEGLRLKRRAESSKSDNVSVTSSKDSTSTSSNNASDFNNTSRTMLERRTIQRNCISSHAAEDDACSWITCSDSDSNFDDEHKNDSLPFTIRKAREQDNTPLALRILFLRRSANQTQGQTQAKHTVPEMEDDVD